MYNPTLFVEPLGYQPVEFLDIPPMNEALRSAPPRRRDDTGRSRLDERRTAPSTGAADAGSD